MLIRFMYSENKEFVLIGNCTCLRGAIQDHHGPLFSSRGQGKSLNFSHILTVSNSQVSSDDNL